MGTLEQVYLRRDWQSTKRRRKLEWASLHNGPDVLHSAALLTLMADRAPAPVAAEEASESEKLSDAKK